MAGHEPYVAVPISVQFSSLLAANDIAQAVVPGTGSDVYTIMFASASCRALVSGTATPVVLNGAGSTIFSLALSGAAPLTATSSSPSVATIVGGDKLRFGLSGIGVGLSDVSVTVWIKMISVA